MRISASASRAARFRCRSPATFGAAASWSGHSVSRYENCYTTTAAGPRAVGRYAPSRSAGLSGAYIPESQFDLPLDYEALSGAGALLGHGGVVAFDDTVDMARMARYALEFCAVESCGKCTPCRIGSTRGVELMDRVIANVDRERNLALVDELCETLLHGSLCGLGGMTPFPVRSAMKHFPEDFCDARTAAGRRWRLEGELRKAPALYSSSSLQPPAESETAYVRLQLHRSRYSCE